MATGARAWQERVGQIKPNPMRSNSGAGGGSPTKAQAHGLTVTAGRWIVTLSKDYRCPATVVIYRRFFEDGFLLQQGHVKGQQVALLNMRLPARQVRGSLLRLKRVGSRSCNW
jgi:hypothetical protein